MAIFGSFIPKNELDGFYTESVDIGDLTSIVFEEYLNQQKLLESCSSSKERMIIESKLEVLQELSFRDIKDKIVKAIQAVIRFISEIGKRIKGFFTRNKDNKKKIAELESKVKELETKYNVSISDVAAKESEIEKLKEEIKDANPRIKELEGEVEKKQSQIDSAIQRIFNSMKSYLSEPCVYFDLYRYFTKKDKTNEQFEALDTMFDMYKNVAQMYRSDESYGDKLKIDSYKDEIDEIRDYMNSDKFDRDIDKLENLRNALINASLTTELIEKINEGKDTIIYNGTLDKYIKKDLEQIMNSKNIEKMTLDDVIELAKEANQESDKNVRILESWLNFYNKKLREIKSRFDNLASRSSEQDLRAFSKPVGILADIIRSINVNIDIIQLFISLCNKKDGMVSKLSEASRSINAILNPSSDKQQGGE